MKTIESVPMRCPKNGLLDLSFVIRCFLLSVFLLPLLFMAYKAMTSVDGVIQTGPTPPSVGTPPISDYKKDKLSEVGRKGTNAQPSSPPKCNPDELRTKIKDIINKQDVRFYFPTGEPIPKGSALWKLIMEEAVIYIIDDVSHDVLCGPPEKRTLTRLLERLITWPKDIVARSGWKYNGFNFKLFPGTLEFKAINPIGSEISTGEIPIWAIMVGLWCWVDSADQKGESVCASAADNLKQLLGDTLVSLLQEKQPLPKNIVSIIDQCVSGGTPNKPPTDAVIEKATP